MARGQSAPTITQQPTNVTVLAGSNATFSVGVSGVGPFNYQWRFNGGNVLLSGTTLIVAGNGTASYSGDGGAATNTSLDTPTDVAVDASDNVLIADFANNRIRKVNTSGIMTTFAGNGVASYSGDGGAATNAGLNQPASVALDAKGEVLIADYGHNCVRKVDSNGIITTIAGNGSASFSGDGGPATKAGISGPEGVAADSFGNIFISDTGNNLIRKVDANGIITTVAGGGTANPGDGGAATNASLNYPTGIAVDALGNVFFVGGNDVIVRKVDTNGILTAVTSVSEVAGVTVDVNGNLFISEYLNPFNNETSGNIVEVPAIGEAPTTGGDINPLNIYGAMGSCAGLAVDLAGNLFIADQENAYVREVVNPGPILVLSNVTVYSAGSYDVVITSPFGSVTSSVATLTVLAPPLITTQPASQTVAAGSNASFSVSALGPPTSVFQWYFDGAAMSGQTNDTLLLGAAYLTNTGSYEVVVTNLYGAATSSVATLAVSVLTGQPKSQSAGVGTNLTLSVTTVGAAPYNYLWFFDGGELPGQTNSSLSFSPVEITNAGTYEVVVSNVYATVTSSVATLTVGYPPVIAVQPSNLTNLAGGSVSLSVAVSGTGAFTYQWQHDGTNLPNGIINTVAGGGSASPSTSGAATNAYLGSVADVALDASGNFFPVDQLSNQICRVSIDGNISVVAGTGLKGFSGDGSAAVNAKLNWPSAVAVDSSGNIFIADSGNERIREVRTNGIISTVAGTGTQGYAGDGGKATNASLYLGGALLGVGFTYSTHGLVVDSNGNLFFADTYNNRIRRVGTNGIITTVAGNGTQSYSGDGSQGTNTGLFYPTDLVFDSTGNMFIADTANAHIRRLGTNGIIVTVATNATLHLPDGLAMDASSNLFMADGYFYMGAGPGLGSTSSLVFGLYTNGMIEKIAGGGPPGMAYGDGGQATEAFLDAPGGICVDQNGNLFLADTGNGRVRKVIIEGPVLTINNLTTNNAGFYDVIVTGPFGSVTSSVVSLTVLAPAAITAQPQSQAVPVGSNTAFNVAATGTPPIAYQWYFDGTAMTGQTNSALDLTMVTLTNSGSYQVVVTNLYGAATSSIANLSVGFGPQIIVQPQSEAVVLGGSAILTVTASGTGPLSYQWQLNGTNLSSRTITTFAGGKTLLGDDGPATNAALNEPMGVATDASGNVFIADTFYERVRKVGTNGIITTVAGNGGSGETGDGGSATAASLDEPFGVAVDGGGNLFVSDYLGGRIRRVGTNGIISTVLTNGPHIPRGIAVDADDNLFIALGAAATVIKLAPNGAITTVAGKGTNGDSGDGGQATNALLREPVGVALDASGNLFIADEADSRIRRVGTNGIITTVAGNGSFGFHGDGGPATNATLNSPWGVAVDAGGNLFIADTGNNCIREVGPNGIILTVAGDSSAGFSGDGGAAASAALNQPYGVAVDPLGNLFIADTDNNRIRLAAQGPAFAFTNISLANAGSYDVVVSSPYGAVTSAFVSLTVFAPPQNLSASLSLGQGVQFQFTGTPGYPYVLLVTTNLAPPVNWQPLVTNVADTNGNWTYVDTNTANPAQFYRALAP